MRFEFATASRLIFGPGTLKEVAMVRELGSRVFLVTGGDPSRAEDLIAILKAAGMEVSRPWRVRGEPTVDMVNEGRRAAVDAGCDVVIGFGGGSVIDAAKAVAGLLANPGSILEYVEIVGAGKPLLQRAVPWVAISTTAGTGAEVTRNAVLGVPAHGVKVSLRSPHLLAWVAIVDPELTFGLPPSLTAATGMDALTQLIEPMVCSRANPMTDGFCREGLARVAGSLRRAFHDGDDPGAREDMALGSLLGGLALANSGLGAVHGFAAPLGGRFGAPHGAVCAALLPAVMEMNIRVATDRKATDVLERYAAVAAIVTGNPRAVPGDGVAWVNRLREELGIPGLGAFGVELSHLPDLSNQGARASSMKANPVELTADQRIEILKCSI